MLHLMIFVHNILTQKSSDKQNTVCFHGYCRSKKLRFSFLQERVFICLCNSPIWFDFLKLSMVQECLKHSRGHLSFLQNKIFKLARFKCIKNSLQWTIFPNCPTLHWIRHFGCHFAKQFGKFGSFRYKRLKPWHKVLHFTETVLNVTFNRNSVWNWTHLKFNVGDFSSIFTIMPNGEMIIKPFWRNYTKNLTGIEKTSSKISIFLVQREIIWEFHKFKHYL